MASFFSRLSKAVGFGRARYYIGKDLENNKYYEFPALDGSTDPRKTRRIIRYREFRELGEHNQSALPAQWLMWLRHTRRSAPTIEELVADQERIETTRHNARILEARDAERKLYLEQKAEQETKESQQQQRQRLEPTTSNRTAQSPSAQHARATAVPTSIVSDEGTQTDQQQQSQQRRNVDMEVWEASRRRVEEKSAQQEEAFSSGGAKRRPSQRRDELDQRDAERERARRAMSRSPLADFDVSYEEDAPAPAPAQAEEAQLKPRFGRAVGPGEQWAPKEWTPAPAARRR